MYLEIRMYNDFDEETIHRETIEVSRVPNLNENVMVLTDGHKHCGIVRKVLSSYAPQRDCHVSCNEYYIVECMETDCFEFGK